MDPLIIEVAHNGSASKKHNPNVPRSPDEVAADILECLEAGASIFHSHLEDYTLYGQAAADQYSAAYKQVLAKRPDAILHATGTMAPTLEDRWTHIGMLADAGITRMAFTDPGSCNIGVTDERGVPKSGFVYATPYEEIDYTFAFLREKKLGSTMSIYEPNFLHAALAYERAGLMPQGSMVKFYMSGDYNFMDGSKGQYWGIKATPTGLAAYREMHAGSKLPWAVCVLGGDVTATGLAKIAIEQGGHIRVGLEDYCGPRKPKNLELVEEVVALAKKAGRPLATSYDAAEILNLPRGPFRR